MSYENFTGGTVTPSSGGVDTTKLTFGRRSISYPNPFIDMTQLYLPGSIKGLLVYISAMIAGDPILSQCIIKAAEYPITKLVYNNNKTELKDDKTIKFWKDIFEKKLNIVRELREMGMDRYAYGNSIVSIYYPFQRQLKCPKCKGWHNIHAYKKVKMIKYKFNAKCPCGYNGKMDDRDMQTKEIDKLGLVKWDLSNIEIKYNSISNDHIYYYTIPTNIRTAVNKGDMDIISTLPKETIVAIEKKKPLKLKKDNLYHLKRSAPQYLIPSERGWGVPAVMAVMKDVFHNRILKKGNEMIAFDHIVPLRVLFPQGNGDMSPHAGIDLGDWRSKVEDEVHKWRQDPNYVSVMPLPLGMQNMGGDAKLLMVTQEIKATEDNIIIGIGMIPEIIKGGASWSGSNVSLRVVENTFINSRHDMHEVIDWVKEKISDRFDKTDISIKMADFKMADDFQKKQLMVQVSKGNPSDTLISKTTTIEELGFDPDKEYQNKQDELKSVLELKNREAEGIAEANGAASVINALYGADANMESYKREEKHKAELEQDRQANANQQKIDNADAITEESAKLGPNVSIPQLIHILTERFARLATSDKEEFKIRILGLKQSMPAMFGEVFRNLKEMNLIEADILPSMPEAQKHTPGQLPSNIQGDVTAEDAPSPAEQMKTLPEVNPPRGGNATL